MGNVDLKHFYEMAPKDIETVGKLYDGFADKRDELLKNGSVSLLCEMEFCAAVLAHVLRSADSAASKTGDSQRGLRAAAIEMICKRGREIHVRSSTG